jgi:RimJ/RimL family protein N-acetyltransferase
MIFREATEEDLSYISFNSASRGIQKQCPEQIDYLYTLEHENEPLGVGGFRLINLTTAWCWVDLSEKGHNHVIKTYRTIKEWIDTFAKAHKIRRLQAYVEEDFPQAIRMVEHLGFERESVMKNFIDDKSCYMYVRILWHH